MRGGQRIAVVGAGISGLASAWLLSQKHRVTLYEAAATLGGHTNTVDVTLEGLRYPVDTGFLVFNTQTYPNLTAMFAHLGVASVGSEMSFSVSLDEPRLEWSGSSLATVFGQKRNLLRPDFWRMLSDIVRFNRESVAWLESNPGDCEERLSLREFLAIGGYSRPFADWYLLPMAAAIWSCPAAAMLDYPLASFVRFCRNHGLLQVFDRPIWRTVSGGGREYVRKLAACLDDVRLATPVRAVGHRAGDLRLHTDLGVEHYDQIVLACHSDQALAIMGDTATRAERRLLGAIRYAPNRAVLHTDADLLPRSPALWSAWNYLSSGGEGERCPVSVSYLINRLQPLPFKTPLMVSLNPQREPLVERVIAEFEYQHPIFDASAIAAQRQLPAISGARGVWFCGAWNGYGFHEDGLKSALQVANAMGCHAPWQGVDGAARERPAATRTAELAA
ncbi:MAG TPA: NAD/FAD-binding protein [Candidatus Accumulibacter sp.]|nr:NAD/FAD-binding protein [Accumulibacter sp.]